MLLLYVLLLLLVVGEVGVLTTAVGLNSSASGFSLDDLRVLCREEECVASGYACMDIIGVAYSSTTVDETSSTVRKTYFDYKVCVCVFVCACVRACVRVCVCVCVCEHPNTTYIHTHLEVEMIP